MIAVISYKERQAPFSILRKSRLFPPTVTVAEKYGTVVTNINPSNSPAPDLQPGMQSPSRVNGQRNKSGLLLITMMQMEEWHKWMKSGISPVILDGSLGEELLQRGVDFGFTKLWAGALLARKESDLRESPAHELKKLAHEYLDAGADIITTATYQTTVSILCDEFSINSEEARQILRSAASILIDTRASYWGALAEEDKLTRRYPAIAASIGPFAAILPNDNEYQGRYEGVSYKDFVNFHEERIRCIAVGNAAPDVLGFETIPSDVEARAICSIMSASDLQNVPYWISFQCRDGCCVANGISLRQAVLGVLENCGSTARNLFALGVNCVQPRVLPALIEVIKNTVSCFMRQNPDKYWVVGTVAYPNQGGAWCNGAWTLSDSECKSAEEWAQTLLSTGAEIVGGCCRTGPSNISRLYKARREDAPTKAKKLSCA